MKSSTVSSTQEYVYSETKTGPPAKHFPYNLGLSFLLCKIEESGWTTSQVIPNTETLGVWAKRGPIEDPGEEKAKLCRQRLEGGRCGRRV